MKLLYTWNHIVKGAVIGQIKRFIDDEGKKLDIPCYWPRDNGKWSNKQFDGDESGSVPLSAPYPLVGLESIASIHEPIIICEGQKVRQFVESLGHQAVSSLFGSSSAHLTDWSPLQFARTILIAGDEDDAGRKYEREVWEQLQKFGSFTKTSLLHFPKLKKGSDACDWGAAQPELADWNELDPVSNHPQINALKARFTQLIAASTQQIPAQWIEEASWQEPETIDKPLRPVHRLPIAMLPSALRDWMNDTAERMECPLEYCAVSGLAAIGSVIGGSCGVRPKQFDTEYTIYPNLWGIVTGPPGSLKSPAMGEMMRPLRKHDSAAYAEYKSKLNAYEAQKVAFDGDVKNKKDTITKTEKRDHAKDAAIDELERTLEQEPEAPACTRYVVNDATIEAMCVILQANPKGVLLFQDELYGLLASWNSENKQKDRPFYLTAWNANEPYTVDRKTSGIIRIESTTVSILGGMQPDTIGKYLLENADNLNDGLLQRFQLSIYISQEEAARATFHPVDRAPNAEARETANALISQLIVTDYISCGASYDHDKGRPYFRFSEPAQKFFLTWLGDNRVKISQQEEPMIQQHLNKYDKLMASLALIFHLTEVLTGSIKPGPITLESAEMAAAWCAWLEEHARRIYALAGASQQKGGVLAEKIQKRKLHSRFTEREIARKQWRGLKKPEDIKKACKELVEANWLKMQMKSGADKGGRPSQTYVINPKVGDTARGGQIPK